MLRCSEDAMNPTSFKSSIKLVFSPLISTTHLSQYYSPRDFRIYISIKVRTTCIRAAQFIFGLFTLFNTGNSLHYRRMIWRPRPTRMWWCHLIRFTWWNYYAKHYMVTNYLNITVNLSTVDDNKQFGTRNKTDKFRITASWGVTWHTSPLYIREILSCTVIQSRKLNNNVS